MFSDFLSIKNDFRHRSCLICAIIEAISQYHILQSAIMVGVYYLIWLSIIKSIRQFMLYKHRISDHSISTILFGNRKVYLRLWFLHISFCVDQVICWLCQRGGKGVYSALGICIKYNLCSRLNIAFLFWFVYWSLY